MAADKPDLNPERRWVSAERAHRTPRQTQRTVITGDDPVPARVHQSEDASVPDSKLCDMQLAVKDSAARSMGPDPNVVLALRRVPDPDRGLVRAVNAKSTATMPFSLRSSNRKFRGWGEWKSCIVSWLRRLRWFRYWLHVRRDPQEFEAALLERRRFRLQGEGAAVSVDLHGVDDERSEVGEQGPGSCAPAGRRRCVCGRPWPGPRASGARGRPPKCASARPRPGRGRRTAAAPGLAACATRRSRPACTTGRGRARGPLADGGAAAPSGRTDLRLRKARSTFERSL